MCTNDVEEKGFYTSRNFGFAFGSNADEIPVHFEILSNQQSMT
jgi:hypothetical protein